MIRYLKHKDINKQSWDKCIRNSVNELFYAYSWYLDIVCPNWDALVEGEYKCVMPLTKGSKFGLKFLYQPFYTQQLGVFSKEQLNSSHVKEFLIAIPNKFLYNNISLNSSNKFEYSVFRTKYRHNYILDLNKPYEILQAAYSKSHKKNIKTAQKNNLGIVKNIPVDIVYSSIKNNLTEKSVKVVKEKHYVILENLFNYFKKNDLAKTYAVTSQKNKYCATALFFKFKNRFIIFSSTNNEGRDIGAIYYLIDSFIKEHSDQNLILDFAGSDNEGIAYRNKGFGAVEEKYINCYKNNLPWPLSKIYK